MCNCDFPEIVGIVESAELLGCSKGHVYNVWRDDPMFPAPVARLRRGPIWLKSEIVEFSATFIKKGPGRKPKLAMS